MEPSWLTIREDDLFAEKWEKMLFESFRSFGEAGDSGWAWKGAFGDASSVLWKWLGEVGLLGLMGALVLSLPFLPLMANDNVVDLGILRSCLRGGVQD
jgi:hypothetical protein